MDRSEDVVVQPACAVVLRQFSVRTAVVLLGFYFVAQGDWRRIMGCVAGFLGARLFVVRLTRLKEGA